MKKAPMLSVAIFVCTLMLTACGGLGHSKAPKDITSFTILGIPGTIVGTNITLTVPFGTDPSSLTPTIVHTGASVSPESGVPHNFTTSPQTYTVTAEDGSTKDYAVTVTVAAAP